jgi:hypothetical protein
MAISTKTCILFDLTGKRSLETAQNAGNQVERFPPFSFKFDIMPLISNVLAMQPHSVKVMRLLYEFRRFIMQSSATYYATGPLRSG